jgi:hypothetical protein
MDKIKPPHLASHVVSHRLSLLAPGLFSRPGGHSESLKNVKIMNEPTEKRLWSWVSGFISQICNEVGIRALRQRGEKFIIKTHSNFYKTLAMR